MLGYGIQGFSDNATFGVGQNRTDMKVVSNLFGDLANCPIKRHIIFVSGNISARNTAECNVHTEDYTMRNIVIFYPVLMLLSHDNM